MNANDISQWLRLFQTCIRQKDYATARTLFHSDARTFGANGTANLGLDNIHRLEWLDVWTNQVNFTFAHKTISVLEFGAAAVVTILWHSRGKIHGSPEREGRATFVLHLFNDGKEKQLLCLHSHNSQKP